MEKYFQDRKFAITSMLLNVNSLPKWLYSQFDGSKTGEVLDNLRNEMAQNNSVMRNVYD